MIDRIVLSLRTRRGTEDVDIADARLDDFASATNIRVFAPRHPESAREELLALKVALHEQGITFASDVLPLIAKDTNRVIGAYLRRRAQLPLGASVERVKVLCRGVV